MGFLPSEYQRARLMELFQAFNHRSYEQSERLSRELCVELHDSVLLQIFLISSFRLERSEAEINRNLIQLRSGLELAPWESTLLKITTGQESNFPHLLETAATARHRCSVYYYMAHRMVFMGLSDMANQCFAGSSNCRVDTIEHSFAVMECETRGITVNEQVRSEARTRVDLAHRRALALFEEGRHAESLQTARAALQLAEEELGENYISTCACLNVVGATMSILGQKHEARPYFERALAIQRKVYTDKHDDVIGSLDHLASLYKDMGDLELALGCYSKIVAIRRKWRTSKEGNADELSDALAALGKHLHTMGRFPDAKKALEEDLTILQGKYGDDNEKTALAKANLAAILSELGEYTKARQFHLEAIPVVARHYGAEHPQTAAYYNNFASLLSELGEYEEAFVYCEKAYSILASIDENNPIVALIRVNLAHMLLRKREVAKARNHYEKALSIVDERLGDHPYTAICLNNVGNLLVQELGDYVGARPYLERALAIRKKVLSPNHPDTATTLNNLGQLLEGIGDASGARGHYEEALSIRRVALGNSHSMTAQVLNNLGILCHRSGNLKDALRYETEAIKIREGALPANHPDLALNHAALGSLLRTQGNIDDAKEHFQQALSICQKAFGDKHLYTALSLSNLGIINQNQGQMTVAQSYHLRALAMVTEVMGVGHPQRISCLINLALSYAASGRDFEAICLMSNGAEVADRMIGQVFALSSESRREAYLRQIRFHLDISLHLASQRLANSAHAIKIAVDLVLRRKGLAAEALVAQREAVLSGRYPDLQSQFKELLSVRSLIARTLLDGPGQQELDTYRGEIQKWTIRQEQLESALARQIPEMNFAERLRATDSHAVALCLPPASALVEFIRFLDLNFEALDPLKEPTFKPQRYLAFVILAGGTNDCKMLDLGDADSIDSLVAGFRSSITDRAPDWRERGTQVRRAVFTEKLVDALEGRTRLTLAPDSQLNLLPFEALPFDDDQILADKYQVSYMNCGREALQFAPAPADDAAPPLVVADPDFNLTINPSGSEASREPIMPLSREFDRGMRFKRLDATREEGKKVAALLHVEPWVGAQALESRIKRLHSPRLLHLATHGFFLPDQVRGDMKDLTSPAPLWAMGGRLLAPFIENPLLRSGLALAGANTWLRNGTIPDDAEDGLLTAEDVTGMDLMYTDLVVLSACETALGQVRSGEGVYGLRRAFAIAGARTLVMSLWKVPDNETRDLMIEFYAGLIKAKDIAQALHEAQQTVRRNHPEEPYYWAAFICQGSTAPLKGRFDGISAQ